jgi:predicted DNA-binding protein (MmcQ/YjbR family)
MRAPHADSTALRPYYNFICAMNVESLRRFCMSFPHATEIVQWGDNLVFKIAGKMFAVVDLRPPNDIAFKCDPEKFAELTEREGIIPAPYMARAQWVSVQHHDAVEANELKDLIRNSYEIVKARLPRKVRATFSEGKRSPRKPGLRK